MQACGAVFGGKRNVIPAFSDRRMQPRQVFGALALIGTALLVARSGRSGPGRTELDQPAGIGSAMQHLSSSALVQHAAAACARDDKCVPSVDELVKRAAAACSRDPSCVCDWGKFPKQCFLSEVQRHKQLERSAKALVHQINQRAATDHAKKAALTRLEHEDESFETVLKGGRKALGAGDFEAGKSALAKAEYLHEVALRDSGDDHGPVLQQQEHSLKTFARELVEAEAEHRARNRHHRSRYRGGGGGEGEGARDREHRHRRGGRRGRNAGIVQVETQIKALSSNVQKLMHKVGVMEHRNRARHAASSSNTAAPVSPKADVRLLVHKIAELTGHLEHAEHSRSRGRAGAREDRGQGDVRRRGGKREGFDMETLAHEESLFAQAIARGNRAAWHGRADTARMALRQVWSRRASREFLVVLYGCVDAVCATVRSKLTRRACAVIWRWAIRAIAAIPPRCNRLGITTRRLLA